VHETTVLLFLFSIAKSAEEKGQLSAIFSGPQFVAKPGFGIGPITLGGFLGDIQDLRDVNETHADETMELNHLSPQRFLSGQFVQGFVNAQQLVRFGFNRQFDGFQIHALETASMFNRLAAARALDQNPAHGFRGRDEKLSPIFPTLLLLADNP